MKIKPLQVLKDYTGADVVARVVNEKGEVIETQSMTIVRAASLFLEGPNDRFSLPQKFDRHQLLELLSTAKTADDEVELTHNQCVLLRDGVGANAPSLIYGRLKELIGD